ncbi:unnamed protein product, partial [Choristocarpus tenellus]
ALYPPTHGGDRGYSERQKIMAAHVEGQFAEVFFTPINLGGGRQLRLREQEQFLSRIRGAVGCGECHSCCRDT